jgi:hypothetical protein
VLGKGGRHLGSAGVLNADEQQFGNGLDQATISLGGSGELLFCESRNQYWQEVGDGGCRL